MDDSDTRNAQGHLHGTYVTLCRTSALSTFRFTELFYCSGALGAPTTAVRPLQLENRRALEVELIDVRFVDDQWRTQNDFAASQFEFAKASRLNGLRMGRNLVLCEQ